MKSDEVEKFLADELLPAVEVALGEASDTATEQHEEVLREAEQKALEGVLIPSNRQLCRIRGIIWKWPNKASLRPAIFTTTSISFLIVIIDGGDFMSLRRNMAAGKEAYLIPYNGEEVKLHRANADQYYIKTTANYQSFLFNLDD